MAGTAAGTVTAGTIVTGAAGNFSRRSNRPVQRGPVFVSAVFSFQSRLAHDVAVAKPARSLHVIPQDRSKSGAHHEAFDRRRPCHGRALVCRPVSDQSGPRGDTANEGADIRCFSRDRTQRAPPPSAPLSLRLSSVLPALLLRAAHLLSAVSLLRAGPVPARSRLWSILVMSVRANRD